jgi:hypothetical protein
VAPERLGAPWKWRAAFVRQRFRGVRPMPLIRGHHVAAPVRWSSHPSHTSGASWCRSMTASPTGCTVCGRCSRRPMRVRAVATPRAHAYSRVHERCDVTRARHRAASVAKLRSHAPRRCDERESRACECTAHRKGFASSAHARCRHVDERHSRRHVAPIRSERLTTLRRCGAARWCRSRPRHACVRGSHPPSGTPQLLPPSTQLRPKSVCVY